MARTKQTATCRKSTGGKCPQSLLDEAIYRTNQSAIPGVRSYGRTLITRATPYVNVNTGIVLGIQNAPTSH